MATAKIPRLMVAAAASGGGKTTFTCALLRALLRRGVAPAAFKCGPDYIDPMFHANITGAKSSNLDLYFFSENTARALLAEGAKGCGIAVLEGVMGYYDGLGGTSTTASSYHLAKATGTPVVLLVGERGASATLAAVVKGLAEFRRDSGIRGVLLNRVSPMLYPGLKKLIEEETGLPVLGYLPTLADCALESRHLGLITPQEAQGLEKKVEALAEALEKTVDLPALLTLAEGAPTLEWEELPRPRPRTPVRIGVARDEAFCFYYRDSLELLAQGGATLVEFSPIRDRELPQGLGGLLLGGGYPELYAKALGENKTMRESIRRGVEGGLPTIAECGGFLYLHRSLEDPQGKEWPMAGVLEGKGYKTGKLGPFGYGQLTAQRDSLLLDKGESLAAHEFHYWGSTSPGEDFRFRKESGKEWTGGWGTGTLYAGFPHFHFGARPQAAERFLGACARYKKGDEQR